MAERTGPTVYSIAAHRGFADALVAGLLPRYADKELGLARLTLLLPSRRAERTLTEAFVRALGESGRSGLLLPRMAVVGDLELEETLGPLLDPLAHGTDIPPAADTQRRWLRLAHYLREQAGQDGPKGAALLRLALEAGRTMDRLLVEGIDPWALLGDDVLAIIGDLAGHWRESTGEFLRLATLWQDELSRRGEVDAPTRRNLLFDHAARTWRDNPPPHPIVAAGITSASPALARLLRVVSELPRSAVVLPDLDLVMDPEVWASLGRAGVPDEAGGEPFGSDDALTHPQYHLKLLLNRMGVARGEVQPWHRSGLGAAPPERSKAISSLFLPPAASAAWATMNEEVRRLSGVRLMESDHPGEEAQAIAVLIRKALGTPEKRVALVTPDRALAARVIAQLERWAIVADDTAGQPLSLTAAGRLLLLLAETMAEQAAPVPLIALLGHPLARAGTGRPAWLEAVRALDLKLRGPRPDAGLEPLGKLAEPQFWGEVEPILAPLLDGAEERGLAEWLDLLVAAAESLCGDRLWANADGRALATFIEELRIAAREVELPFERRELAAALRDAMERTAVRPPWGGHPRVAIYGLIEARMSRADLVICAGLTEGTWPASSATDALLPPAVLRHLGVPSGDFRIGLSAHDLASALGAPEVVLSWAKRDSAGPAIPSRFVLRVQAMLGADLAGKHREDEAVRIARTIDIAPRAADYARPRPRPDPQQRRVDISASGLDRLRSDPYQFYASEILRLKRLDSLDAEPSAAWQGTAVHAILDRWHRDGEVPGQLVATAEAVLDSMSAHPLMRRLWRPRLVKALEWIDEEIVAQRNSGRVMLDTECWGEMELAGIRIHARADRIDRMPDGSLAVVDYKTGQPPSGRMVEQGYALQLGLIGLIAEAGGFKDISGAVHGFEYWSLKKKEDRFGFVYSPALDPGSKAKTGIPREDFLPITRRYLIEALEKWIIGNAPFTARENPDLAVYADYDQLMRLDEWLPLLSRDEAQP